MKVLKTIVATAVIVFALTSVAMAGVQHFTKQSGQTTGGPAQTAQPTYTVTLTAAQLAQLMNGGKAATAGGTQHHAQRTQHHAKAAHHQARSHDGSTTRTASNGTNGTHHYEATHHASSSTSSAGGHHAETSHHSGGGEGGSCGD